MAKHTAVINKDGGEDASNNSAQKWIGATEEYILQDNNDKTTTLFIKMKAHPDFATMLERGWNQSLNILKTLCEQ